MALEGSGMSLPWPLLSPGYTKRGQPEKRKRKPRRGQRKDNDKKMPVRYVDFELGEGARIPYKRHAGDAGWDLFVSRDCIIPPGATVDIHTDLKIDMPPFLYARITGRSSSLRNHGLLVNEGIIDNGYTGEMFICVHNLGDKPFHVKQGMRLAQVLFHVIEDVRWAQVDSIKPTPGRRGNNGFGSTGE